METVIELFFGYSIDEKIHIVQLFVSSSIGFLDVRSGGGRCSVGVLWEIALIMSNKATLEVHYLANVVTLLRRQGRPVGAE